MNVNDNNNLRKAKLYSKIEVVVVVHQQQIDPLIMLFQHFLHMTGLISSFLLNFYCTNKIQTTIRQ